MSKALLASLVVLGAVAVLAAANAQGANKESPYPNKPIRVVIPFAPGGTPDLQLRILGEKLVARLGQPLVHDYRPGAAGNIGMEIVARAPSDG